jgi:putative ABC transport system permease protein
MIRNSPGERWYGRLLRLYPKDFRDEFGGEMTRLYRDRGRREPWWSLWSHLLLDLIRTAPTEHVAILLQDLRHAWRGLRRTPVITATAILTLALGVGASTAVFSVVHAVVLRPLPYPDSSALVELFESDRKTGSGMRASALNYLSWSERSQSFDAIAAFGSTGLTLTDDGDPEMLGGSVVTASLFKVLRVAPIVGRTLQPDDEQRASPPVVVISERLWRTRFGGDPGIVGRSMTLDGQRYQVVGVMPRVFREVGRQQATATAAGQIFVPMIIDRAQENRANHTLRVVGRLRRDVPLEQARIEMGRVAAALESEFPATNTNAGVGIERLFDTTLEPQVHRALLLVLGAVTMVFLIACANVANLTLVRGARRQTELALRTALGAGRSRLVRQLLTESSCLAAISGVAGVGVAAIAHPLVLTLVPATVPRLEELRLDLNILALGLVVSIVSGIVFGVLPALRASRLDLSNSPLLVGRATTDASRARLRQVLIAAQVGVATMLLVAAALLLQGFVRLQRVSLGFEPNGVFTSRIALPRSAYPDAERTGQFYQRLVDALRSSAQLRSFALATSAPFAPGVRASVRLSPLSQGAAEHIVSGGYFQVLGIPIVAGRSFNDRDTPGAAPVAIVSQRLASQLWANANPLGQPVERGGRSYEVIGVVGDVRGSDVQGARGGGPDREPRAAVYFAATQMPQRSLTLIVASNGDSTSVSGLIRQTVRQLDPALPVQPVRPLADWLVESVAPTRLTTRLAALFAVCALLLASVGIYGVVAYSVASRTKEIGVRMAIGASRRRVIGLVLREGMTWAGAGVVVGLLAAFAAARLLTALLFDVPARDPLTFAAAGAGVTLVALLASTIPALRAVRIDPTIAMRAE